MRVCSLAMVRALMWAFWKSFEWVLSYILEFNNWFSSLPVYIFFSSLTLLRSVGWALTSCWGQSVERWLLVEVSRLRSVLLSVDFLLRTVSWALTSCWGQSVERWLSVVSCLFPRQPDWASAERGEARHFPGGAEAVSGASRALGAGSPWRAGQSVLQHGRQHGHQHGRQHGHQHGHQQCGRPVPDPRPLRCRWPVYRWGGGERGRQPHPLLHWYGTVRGQLAAFSSFTSLCPFVALLKATYMLNIYTLFCLVQIKTCSYLSTFCVFWLNCSVVEGLKKRNMPLLVFVVVFGICI